MGLVRVVLPAALLLAAFPVPASQAASAKCPSSTGRFAVWGAGVIANRKTPTARLMEERWLPDGRVEGLIVERLGQGERRSAYTGQRTIGSNSVSPSSSANCPGASTAARSYSMVAAAPSMA